MTLIARGFERRAPILLALTPALWLACADGRAQPAPGDADLLFYTAHVNRTPQQSWPGYGVYLGAGLVLTAAHVPGATAETRPRIAIAGLDLPASTVKEGSLETTDLTLLAFDATKLPLRLRMRRMPLCAAPPYPGEDVVVATPEGTARSRVAPPRLAPPGIRERFSTLIGDVATTGNSGSGVFDARVQCLLGIISRKITLRKRTVPGEPPRSVDIAKYFVPASEIRAFLPAGVSY